MKRRVFTILSAVSLLMFVAVVVMWVRSWHVQEVYNGTRWSLISRRGGLSFLYDRARPNDSVGWWSMPVGESGVLLDVWDPWIEQRFALLGFRTGVARTPSGNRPLYRAVAIPYWAGAGIFGWLPLLWIIVDLRRRWRRNHMLCANCGYDLRATPGRCPECGARAAGGDVI